MAFWLHGTCDREAKIPKFQETADASFPSPQVRLKNKTSTRFPWYSPRGLYLIQVLEPVRNEIMSTKQQSMLLLLSPMSCCSELQYGATLRLRLLWDLQTREELKLDLISRLWAGPHHTLAEKAQSQPLIQRFCHRIRRPLGLVGTASGPCRIETAWRLTWLHSVPAGIQ